MHSKIYKLMIQIGLKKHSILYEILHFSRTKMNQEYLIMLTHFHSLGGTRRASVSVSWDRRPGRVGKPREPFWRSSTIWCRWISWVRTPSCTDWVRSDQPSTTCQPRGSIKGWEIGQGGKYVKLERHPRTFAGNNFMKTADGTPVIIVESLISAVDPSFEFTHHNNTKTLFRWRMTVLRVCLPTFI